MSLSSSQILFFSTLLLGTTLSISSTSWFGAWIGLELNLLSFIPIISSKNNQYSSEAALKYFLIQALGSSIIIMSASLMLIKTSSANILLCIALLLKAGAAPFHFWFPSVMEGLQWPQAIILMTIQKIAPLSLLSYMDITFTYHIMLSAIILSALIGAVGGINQTLLRKIMAYSSINHMAWMLTAMAVSETSWFLYFLFYCLVASSVALLFNSQEAFHISHLFNHTNTSPETKLLTFMALLSLGGLPPFTGFIPKWFIIQEMVSTNLFFILTILLMSALLTLFYYLRISITALMVSAPKVKWSLKSTSPLLVPSLFLFMNFLGLLTPSLFVMIM
uniref:NADH-ubiquinone oxidoreductase chain 2 n=1 Tax=Metapenaeus affinis TaxID=228858 RepID=A0A345X0F0_9EUCA|nr:NADH dehydrogenase subunit 2 [Metapenaeus affinis]AXK15192.1 NADH dehydrogenase subunit 2 [Metapenaeus affinis]UUF68268.1 NADH dehydrogenase subunit 2 [Metapenaeus affinis]